MEFLAGIYLLYNVYLIMLDGDHQKRRRHSSVVSQASVTNAVPNATNNNNNVSSRRHVTTPSYNSPCLSTPLYLSTRNETTPVADIVHSRRRRRASVYYRQHIVKETEPAAEAEAFFDCFGSVTRCTRRQSWRPPWPTRASRRR